MRELPKMKAYRTTEAAKADGYFTYARLCHILPSILTKVFAGDNVAAYVTFGGSSNRELDLMVRVDSVGRGTEKAATLTSKLVDVGYARVVKRCYYLGDVLNALETHLDKLETLRLP